MIPAQGTMQNYFGIFYTYSQKIHKELFGTVSNETKSKN